MAVFTESGDLPLTTGISPLGMNMGDTFSASFGAGDTGDSVWVNTWSNTQDYLVALSGIDDMTASYTVQINDILHTSYTVAVTVTNGVVTNTSDTYGQINSVNVTADGLEINYTPAYHQSYGVAIYNHDMVIDPGYELTVGVAPVAPIAVPTDDADILVGTALGDDINLLAGDDSYSAGDGADTVFAANGADTVLGEGGDDYINGASHDDSIEGNAGNDTLLGASGNDRLKGGADDDHLNGGNGNDNLFGEAGADFLLGGRDNDFLRGGTENDTLDGGKNDDTLSGGLGNDVFIMNPLMAADQIEDFENGVDLIDVTGLKISGMSGLAFNQVGADVLVEFGLGNQVLLKDFLAADLDASDFAFSANPLVGGGSDDDLFGTESGDTMSGAGGRDRVYGNGGDDYLTGGVDKDVLFGGEGNDTLDGEQGNDRMYGDAGADVMIGGGRNDVMFGGTEGDDISGGQGNDKLFGDEGDDTIDGGAGKDALTGGTGSDTFVFGPGQGADTIYDFENGVDVMDLTALGLTDINDLAISQNGSDVLISLDGTYANAITLTGMDTVDVDATDFLF